MATIYKFPKQVIRCADWNEVKLNMKLLQTGMIQGMQAVRNDGSWTLTIIHHQQVIEDDIMTICVRNMIREYLQ